jgi:sugar lactone lactonase YvrE
MKAGTVHFHEPASGRNHSALIAADVDALLLAPCGGLRVGLGDGLWELSPQLELGRRVATIAGLRAECRMNDGAVDAAGRMWLATMHRDGVEDWGGLCRVDADGATRWVDEGYRIANGPALAPDGRSLYVADSPRRVIYRLNLDTAGRCASREVFARFDVRDGFPDGLTLAADGCLWVAHYDGGCVTRFSQDGRRVASIRLPVSKVTACAFGGEGLTTLFITSARQGLDPREGRRQPLAGGLFAAAAAAGGEEGESA